MCKKNEEFWQFLNGTIGLLFRHTAGGARGHDGAALPAAAADRRRPQMRPENLENLGPSAAAAAAAAGSSRKRRHRTHRIGALPHARRPIREAGAGLAVGNIGAMIFRVSISILKCCIDFFLFLKAELQRRFIASLMEVGGAAS